MKIILSTPHLYLREFVPEDADFIIELVNSPGWLRYIGDRNIRTPGAAIEYIEQVLIRSYSRNGFGLYMVLEKEGAVPVGMCGLLKRENLDNPDIGFAFLPRFTGKGYAFEIASATLRNAKEVLGIDTIMAIVQPDNERSIRLLKKLDMQQIRTVRWEDTGEELILFSTGLQAQTPPVFAEDESPQS